MKRVKAAPKTDVWILKSDNMFSDLNPQGLPTAILEIAILLAGAFLIGFLFAWLFHRARAASKRDKDLSSTLKSSKQEKSLKAAQAQWEQKINHLELEKQTLADQLKQWELKKATWESEKASFLRANASFPVQYPFPDPFPPDFPYKYSTDEDIRAWEEERRKFEDHMQSQNQQHQDRLNQMNNPHDFWSWMQDTPASDDNPGISLRELYDRAQQQDLDELRKKYPDLDLTPQLQAKDGEIRSLQSEISAIKGQVSVIEGEKQSLMLQLEQKTAEWKALVEDKQGWEASVSNVKGDEAPNPTKEAALAAELAEVLSQKQTLEQALAEKTAEWKALLESQKEGTPNNLQANQAGNNGEMEKWRKQAEEKEKEAQQLRERMRELQDKAASSGLGGEAVVQLREKLKLAEEESADLKTKVQSLENQLSEPPKTEPDTLNTRIIHKLTQERDQLRKELDLLRAAPTLDSADDLTQIPGITPELQTKLYAQGIRTYAALAEISELDRIRLDRELNLALGTIKAQKWIKKARELDKGNY